MTMRWGRSICSKLGLASRCPSCPCWARVVHRLQNRLQLKYACAGAREKPACIAPTQWLEDHGLDLEREFDMFTVVAMSACRRACSNESVNDGK